MKKGNLPITWVRWRRRRYQALAAQGLDSLAWEIAKGEAKARHRVARVIGNDRAREASVALVSKGGKLSFALTGEIVGLSDEQMSALEELSFTAAGTPA